MYDYKIVEQVTRKKKKLSGALKKTMVFFAVVFVVMGITISQAFMLAGFCLAGLYFIYGIFCQRDYEYIMENEQLTIDVIYGNKYRKTAHELDLRQLEVVGCLDADCHVCQLGLDGLLGPFARLPAVNLHPVALVRLEVVGAVFGDEPPKALSHI